MRSFLATAIVGIILSVSTIAYPADNLFSDEITDEEIAHAGRSNLALEKVSESLDLMQKMMMQMQFQRGECDEVENIEQKAIQGDAEQQYLFGSLYLEGLCVGKNQEKAVEWIRKAADQDNLSAQHDMGRFYFRGDGVQKNNSTAAKWLLKCAEKGEVRCQRLIGYFYAEGEGVPKNTKQAVFWLEKAALQNDELAITRLSAMYINGTTLPEDFAKAEKLLSIGAERGQARNQLLLAMLLSDKSMGRYSLKESYKWSNLATQSQDDQVAQQATELRTRLEGAMTPSDLAEAQSMSSEWTQIKEDEFVTPQKKPLPKIAAVGKIIKEEARAKLTELGIPITRLAFFRSIEEDNFEVFELFVKAGANLNTERVIPRGVTPLYWAIDFGSQRIIEYLLNNGAGINKRNQKNGMTPLVRAIAHERWDVVDRLLDMGASAKQTKETHPDHMVSIMSGTPLGYSLMFDKPELVKRLIEKGASVDELYIYRRTPLINSVQSGYPNNVKVLLNAGADPNTRSDLGETALLACFIQEEPINHIIVELLLKAGASIEYPSSKSTPLFVAVIKGDAEAIHILAKHKYNIDERYSISRDQLPMNMDNEQLVDLLNNGGSPLMVASLLGNYAAAKTLVELGADLRIVVNGNNGKYTVKDLAVKSGNSMLINYLNKY